MKRSPLRQLAQRVIRQAVATDPVVRSLRGLPPLPDPPPDPALEPLRELAARPLPKPPPCDWKRELAKITERRKNV